MASLPSMTPAAAAKAELRARYLRRRRDVPDPVERSAHIWSNVLASSEVRAATVIMAYRSLRGEPETADVIEQLLASGVRLVLPGSERSAPPPGPAELEGLDVVVLPGVAFTVHGHRLGRGGGWYDRFLSELPASVTTIGVAFEEQIVPHLPVESHDVRLDMVVTDRDVFDCR